MSSPTVVAEPAEAPREGVVTARPPRRPGSWRVIEATPTPTSTAQTIARRVATVVSAVGVLALLLMVYEFQLSAIPEARAQAELLATFKQAVPTTTLDVSSKALTEGSPVAVLRIRRVGIDQVVVEGSTPTDLKLGPGHLSASPLPGEYGNSVLEGRRTTYGSPFSKLDSLRKGDRIDVTTGQGDFTYIVSNVKHIDPGQPDVVAGTADSRLTLITSNPAFFATGRLAVIAKLDGDPVAVPSRPPQLEDANQLGVAGDPLGLALGLIWLM
ncbi:MAG: sortase, partial [Candidatus Dormibacteria bacterium]